MCDREKTKRPIKPQAVRDPKRSSAGQNNRPAGAPAAAHGRAPPARPPGDRGAATGLLVRPINFATRTLFILNPDKALPSHDAAPNDQIKYAFAPHDAKTAIS
ncbi:hypothetical protein EVAR_38530_1 [Eumeta japonica]|uniref:Uncharacterized protein n=1 Tax=Eumeta variegata TaxID=151549 RepID=A0A4C1WEK0_EUMVA|nr:hypothetical protein EVAR_38530_1 [Eumeta japonica]